MAITEADRAAIYANPVRVARARAIALEALRATGLHECARIDRADVIDLLAGVVLTSIVVAAEEAVVSAQAK